MAVCGAAPMGAHWTLKLYEAAGEAGGCFVPFDDAPAIEAAISDKTAAVILEPVQGEGGIIVPSPNYFPRVREICDRHGILLIADEVQTGLGRTGKWFP